MKGKKFMDVVREDLKVAGVRKMLDVVKENMGVTGVREKVYGCGEGGHEGSRCKEDVGCSEGQHGGCRCQTGPSLTILPQCIKLGGTLKIRCDLDSWTVIHRSLTNH